MYKKRPNLYIGFHGCDELIRNELVTNPDTVRKSKSSYDWLGNGFYIWENNYSRALQWAKDKQKKDSNFKPSILGVIYQLEYCLDFTDSEYIQLITEYYKLMKEDLHFAGKNLPTNKNLPSDIYADLIIRELDCAVIEFMHQKINEQIEVDISEFGFSNLLRFDSVRGIFTEGGPAYEGAGIQTKNHIQVCIRNLNCIKGFFIPRKETQFQ